MTQAPMPAVIHQAVHGYRDGHRLLRSSVTLTANAARAMLILSDISGQSMQRGFDEYLTGYPLAGTGYYVVAKTWYAPEMDRPGCVWTHSLLVPREHLGEVDLASLLQYFARPRDADALACFGEELKVSEGSPECSVLYPRIEPALEAVVRAVFEQDRPVIVPADTASQVEPAVFLCWHLLWAAGRRAFSFCTGALNLRSLGGELLDLQVVPKQLPAAVWRRSAASAVILDLRAASLQSDDWLRLATFPSNDSDSGLRGWIERAAGNATGRTALPLLTRMYQLAREAGGSPLVLFREVLSDPTIDSGSRKQLLTQLFEDLQPYADPSRHPAKWRKQLLEQVATENDLALSKAVVTLLVEQPARLFKESRHEAVKMITFLLRSKLSPAGEQILRESIALVEPSDVPGLCEAYPACASTIVRFNPMLASSTEVWRAAAHDARDLFRSLAGTNLSEEQTKLIVAAAIASNSDGLAEEVVEFGGQLAVDAALDSMRLSPGRRTHAWRVVLAKRGGEIFTWLSRQGTPVMDSLEVVTWFLDPCTRTHRKAYADLWERALASPSCVATSRVASFGLALALADRSRAQLVSKCFQSVYDSLASEGLDQDAWNWLRDLSPPSSWWRDWDKCERVAFAVAGTLARSDAPLDLVFATARTKDALKKVVSGLDDDRDRRKYLKGLRRSCRANPSVGTALQRELLLGDSD